MQTTALISLINGLEIASIVDDKIGQVALGGAALYGGFKVVNALRNFVSSGTASRVGQSILLNLRRMVGGTAACFTAGTLIETEDGKIPIEQVQAGDHVWSWNEETGAFTLQRVTSTMERTSEAVIDLQIDGDLITVTPEHPFQVSNRGWVSAKDLEIGETVASGVGVSLLVESESIRYENVQVFNFEVENTHTYLVGPDGVIVHNACACGTRSGSLPSAPGIYIIKTPKGETYVGQALDLADRLKQGKHAHSDLICDPANERYTIQVNLGQWKGSTVDAIDMAEEFYIRALGAKSGSSNAGGLNRRFEVNQAELERLTRQYGFPDLMAPTPH